MEFEFSFLIYLLLFFTGACAGFVDSIAGGGGLIALPVLISIGLPPDMALGTNKLQGSFGTFSASYNYIKKGIVKINESGAGILYTFAGAATGAWVVQVISGEFVKDLIPILLLVVFCYTLFSKNLGIDPGPSKIPEHLFYLIFGFGLGFYDGFFGPGTGSFWTAALLFFLGLDMRKASGITRIMNFTSNIVALFVFLINGKILYSAGFCMAAGQIIGARIGSGLAIQKGAGFIRPVFLTVVLLTILQLAYNTYWA